METFKFMSKFMNIRYNKTDNIKTVGKEGDFKIYNKFNLSHYPKF